MTAEPVATYRLQLHGGFTLEDAAAVVPYLAQLGVSHVYLSPFLQAARGSTHGYDVVDPGRVNRELGGEAARQRLCAAVEAAGMGQVLDIVPNHMAIAGDQNPWWWDVLENGPSSPYARYFDVDWESSEERWPNKVLLPVLGDHYGRVLEAGEMQLHYAGGVFTLHYYEHRFPVDPSSLFALLQRVYRRSGVELLGFLAESCARLPRPQVTSRDQMERRQRDQEVIRRLLDEACREDAGTLAAVEVELDWINANPDALDALIDRQNYRLAWWTTAAQDLGYRRFFDINDLAGLRVENPEVFDAVHALPIQWVREGVVDGLRVDHPDGLRDPADYFRRLRETCPDAWIVAEKILEPGEQLPQDWPIAGTTGYDFLNRLQGLFVDPSGEGPMTTLYQEITGESADFAEVALESKHQILWEVLGSELQRLASLFVTICERHRRHRDYSREGLYQTLVEVAASFPVYRTYVMGGTRVTESDRRYIRAAIQDAHLQAPHLDEELLQFLQALLLLRIEGDLEAELALRFQQLTGPAMAKGVEDTAFYRFHRLVALNEVGGDPRQFGLSVDAFHRASRDSLIRHPTAMLASSTHDSKRSEDVRARLVLLSEIPQAWGRAVRAWMQHNARHRSAHGPDPATEYLLYQTLVGAWPIDSERLTAYMEKAIREAKQHTTWTQNDPDYEQAIRDFAQDLLADSEFREMVEAFVAPLILPGRVNSLAQTLVKCTAPGVPDIYQGTELWNLSLVDPDNRRPVDFEQRQRLLAELDTLSADQILARGDEGLPKLWVIREALALRRDRPQAFGPTGGYEPVVAEGSRSRHTLAYLRGGGVLVVVPRLVLGLAGDWQDTRLPIPPGRWRNRLSGALLEGDGDALVADLLAPFPLALLERVEDTQ
ncbi:malto-oligosyltrehalose synthase [Thioalkalivibrio sp.]|uniref:malto-oligosyltrehalose synthase n=1 Tax=Thioalkalivibrio sp. TaxID=2093813 RepID=UPI0035654F2F